MARRLRWALIGGGEGSQIGLIHRLAANLDGKFELVAGAFDVDPERAVSFGVELGLDKDRAYPDWRLLLQKERLRDDAVDVITVATPNSSHYEIARDALQSGFHVLCEKPMTVEVSEAKDLRRLAASTGRVMAVNYGYSGYAMVRQLRQMIQDGCLGKIRLVSTEFVHGAQADATDEDNPRSRWRFDPKIAGVSSVFADCGIHALHLASFVTGSAVTRLSADFASCVPQRQLEDDAMICFRMDGDVVGRLWTSCVAIGRTLGLKIEVFGERGGLSWNQSTPDLLHWAAKDRPTQILERGAGGLAAIAAESSRHGGGLAEGFLVAVANIYKDFHRNIFDGPRPTGETLPTVEDGLNSVLAIHAAAASAKQEGNWVTLK